MGNWVTPARGENNHPDGQGSLGFVLVQPEPGNGAVPCAQGPASPIELLFATIRAAWHPQKCLSIPNAVLKSVRGTCPCCYIIKHIYKTKKEERE